EGLWSQYLEVGIGADAEIFTKSQPMSAVGTGADIGIHRQSTWNNPEPEIVLAINSRGETVGATLGNDVNLRDFEGRSALLLGNENDKNRTSASSTRKGRTCQRARRASRVSRFFRLLRLTHTTPTVRQADITLEVEGPG